MTNAETYLTPDQVVTRWGGTVKAKTLANWRSSGEGPTFQKIGNRIAYPMSSIIEYERRRRFASTGDYGKETA